MKKLLIMVISFYWNISFSQQFLNGGFEYNHLVDCDSININNAVFSSLLDSVYGIGINQNLDLGKDSCSIWGVSAIQPHTGHFYSALERGSIDSNGTSISFLLSQPLLANNTYVISFYMKHFTAFLPINILIGYSNNDSTIGVSIDTTGLADTTWTKQFIYLTPEFDAQYITATGVSGLGVCWSIIDDFSFDTTGIFLSASNLQKESIELFPNPCQNELNVRLQNGSSIFVMNSLGQILIQKSISSEVSVTSIDIHELPDGIYFLQVVNDTRMFMKTFIKY